MSFKPDFYVAVATAAPVISLSCVLLLNDQAGIIFNYPAAKKAGAWRPMLASYAVNTLNLSVQAVVFFEALDGLATENNYLPNLLTALFEAYSILALIMSTGLIAVAKFRLSRYENRRSRISITPANNFRKFRKISNLRRSKASCRCRPGSSCYISEAYR
jgi:hypothetical protein